MRAAARLLVLAAPAVLAASACRSTDTLLPASNDVARGVEFTEYDRDVAYRISRPKEGKRLVPYPVGVDVDGALEVKLHKDELTRGELGADVVDRAQELAARTAEVRGMLAWLETANDHLLQSVAEADDLLALPFDERQRPATKARLDALVRRAADVEVELLDRLDALFPEDSEGGERIDAALEQGLTGVLAAVSAVANEEIARLEREYAAFEARFAAAQSGKKLRIEAFLLRGGDAEPVAVHVPGYDEIAAGNVRTLDRLGLRLNDEERARLAEGVEASRELAEAANRLRRKQATVAAAVADLQTESARRIGELAVQIDATIDTLDGGALAERLERLAADLRTLTDQVAADVRAAAEARADELTALPDELLEGMRTELAEPIITALELLQRARALADEIEELQSADIAEIAALVGRIHGWVTDARAFAEGPLAQAFATAAARLGELDDRVLAILTSDLEDVPKAVVARWRDAPARAELDALRRDVHALLRLVDGLVRVLTGAGFRADQELVRDARGLDVDLETAPDTRIDLRRTSRTEGDELVIKATLLAGDAQIEESRASFLLTRYGWHASIEPSVVLVEADRLAGADDSGGFAPAVAWMHSYTPRPDQGGPWCAVQRALDVGVGVHAAFLSYDPENDAELGLGASLSFWGQRIQLGYGYNLMADGADDGEYYAYVGSSLFALLQDVTSFPSDD